MRRRRYLPPLIFAGLPSSLSTASIPDYTYRFEWDLFRDPPPYAAVFPITGMPTTHPKVQNTICGEQLNAGDPIPASSYWSTNGWSVYSASRCSTVVGGKLFYGYNYPTGSSGNTGLILCHALTG